MKAKNKPHINIIVAVISALAGILSWAGIHYIYATYKEQISGPLLIGLLCVFLFAVIFLSVMGSSMMTGSFDKNSPLYEDLEHTILYFAGSLIIVFMLSMSLEFLYELNPNYSAIAPSSYTFVIDESVQ